MINSFDISGVLAVDAQSVNKLRLQARKDPEQALKGAARQFEALFMNMLLKSMREATPQDGPFNSEQTRLYTSLLDQQLAQNLSAKGIGLADIMTRQLTRTIAPGVPQPPAAAAAPAADPAPARQSGSFVPPVAREFVNKVWNYARDAGQAIGIPAQFVVAQAALESGWGKHEIRRADGNPSFNLFGIKAGRNWSGPVVETVTTEHVNGTPQKTVEKFRAYGSYAEAFRDYGNLLRGNPRYAAVLDQRDAAGFARGLQQAGYATDPMYADKLMRILQGNTLRLNLTT